MTSTLWPGHVSTTSRIDLVTREHIIIDKWRKLKDSEKRFTDRIK